MIPTIVSIGRFVYYVGAYTYENKMAILTAYSLFDTTKFSIYTLDRIGVLDLIKKKILYEQPKTVLLEIEGVEETDVGSFEIIHID